MSTAPNKAYCALFHVSFSHGAHEFLRVCVRYPGGVADFDRHRDMDFFTLHKRLQSFVPEGRELGDYVLYKKDYEDTGDPMPTIIIEGLWATEEEEEPPVTDN